MQQINAGSLGLKRPRNSVRNKAQSTQDAQRDAKQMEPIDVNVSVHTARKQHQSVRICARVSCVDEA